MGVRRDCKRNYKEDMAIFQTNFVIISMIVFMIAMVIFPFVVNKYLLYIMTLAGIAVIGSLGLNIITGFTGQISLGQVGFLAIGAYSSAILTLKLNFPFFIAMPISGLIVAFSGLIVAIPSLRLKGLYLAITTFAFAFIVDHIVVRWTSLTGGPFGMKVPVPTIGGFAFDTDIRFYFLVLFMVVIATLYATNLVRTKSGRAFIAIRDNDTSAGAIGINLSKYKIQAFVISSFYVGIAGSLYAHFLSFIDPVHFTFVITIEYFAMIIVGGMGSILGSIYGAIFITLLPEGIRILIEPLSTRYPLLLSSFGELKAIINGVIIVIVLIFEPDGLYGRWRSIKTYWKPFPFRKFG